MITRTEAMKARKLGLSTIRFVHFLQNFGELPGISRYQCLSCGTPFPFSQEENMHIYYSGSYYMIDID